MNERHRLILDVATEGFWDWDIKTDQVYLSPRYCELIGYSADDTVFDRAFYRSIIFPDDRAHVFTMIEEHLQGRSESSLTEYRMISKDGTLRWIEGRGKVVEHDERGKPSRMVGTIVDIGARKQAELRLQASEEQFRAAFEGASDAIFWADAATGILINCNRAAEELLEARREEIIGKHQTSLHPPESADQFRDQFLRMVALHSTCDNAEATVLSSSGRRIPVHIKHSVTKFGGRDVMQGVFRDISEQKLAEEAQRQSHALLDILSRQMPGILFQALITPDGLISIPYASDKIHDIYELAPEQVGEDFTPVAGRFHPEDRERILASILAARDTLTTWQCEYRVLLPRQGLKWLYGAGTPQRLDDGSVAMYGIVMDITDRKLVEEALGQSQKLLSSIVDNAPYAFFVKDATDEFRVVLWNRTAEAIFGIPAADIIGRSAHDLWPEEQADVFLAADRAVVASRAMSDTPEEASIHPVLGTIYLHTRKFPLIDEAGAVTSIVVISEDITSRKQAEDQIRALNAGLENRVLTRTAELEAAVRELESFCYSVSHDLRAPLRHINSFSAILTEDYGAALPEEARHYLERIAGTTRRMGSLIDHLLVLSRVSRAELTRDQVDLSEIARGIAGMLRETEPMRSVEFCIQGGLLVQGDRELLTQLLDNLLGNAWKYSSGRAAARIEFGRDGAAGHGSFFVRDNGTGFDMAYKERLFEVFQRLHGSEFEGLGIGLATAQRIVQRHNGTIWAQGKVDEGATFYFTL